MSRSSQALAGAVLGAATAVGTSAFSTALARLNRKLALIPRSPQVVALIRNLDANQMPAKGGFLNAECPPKEVF